MARPPNIIPPTKLNVSLPADLRAWLDLHLWSDVQNRVPMSAYQKLIVRLLTEYRASLETKESFHAPTS